MSDNLIILKQIQKLLILTYKIYIYISKKNVVIPFVIKSDINKVLLKKNLNLAFKS